MDKLFLMDSYQDFELVTQKIINNLTYCSSNANKTQLALDCNEIKEAEDDLRELLCNSNFDMKKVGEAIALKGWDKDRIQYFIDLLHKENTELLYASLNYHISEYGEVITQSDWLLKIVLGTSELNKIKYPLLQLVLSTVDHNGIQRKKLYELNKDVLRKTIESLELISGDS